MLMLVYMKAIQIMTGRGGWPLNIVTLPDGRPVWVATYLKKKNDRILNQLQELYQSAPEKMIDYAENYIREFQEIGLIQNDNTETEVNQNVLKLFSRKMEKKVSNLAAWL
jgi:uncharacterized protein YyaL (SSP411 family)